MLRLQLTLHAIVRFVLCELVWRLTNQFRGAEWTIHSVRIGFYAEVTAEGVVRYREETKTYERIYFHRVFEILRLTLVYAVGIYREYGYSGKVSFRLEVAPTKGRRLETGSGAFWPNYIAESDSVEILREADIGQLELSIADIIEGVFLEFVRFFNRQITTQEAADWTRKFLLTDAQK